MRGRKIGKSVGGGLPGTRLEHSAENSAAEIFGRNGLGGVFEVVSEVGIAQLAQSGGWLRRAATPPRRADQRTTGYRSWLVSFLNSLLNEVNQLLRVLNIGLGVGDRLEAAQRGLGIEQRVGQTACFRQQQGDVVARRRRAVDIAHLLEIGDSAVVMPARPVKLPGIGVNGAELIVRHRQIVHRVRWEQGERLLIVVGGGVQMLEQLGLRCSGGTRFLEAFVGDAAKLVRATLPG